MEKLLAQFHNNEQMREAVHEFMIESLKDITVNLAFNGKDTVGITHAKKAIDESFIKLTSLFAKKSKVNIENQAR